MTDALFSLLRCPFCGGGFNVVEDGATHREAGALIDGVIWCECCAFPVVSGIPVLRSDEQTRTALGHIEAGRHEAALFTMLALDGARGVAFAALLARGTETTYRDAIEVLSPDPEGTYFVYRFSDPTFVMAEAVLRALAQHPAALSGHVLDVCGGSGHLTRVLTSLPSHPTVVVADMFFWKLWLARTYTAPASLQVCCDANQPLPFRRGAFPGVVLSDAFPYIWHKRLLADEMARLAGPDGVIVMPHLHSSLGWNFSAGMTLTPASYAALFASHAPRLFADPPLLSQAISGDGIDLSKEQTIDELAAENSFTLIASRDASLFRAYAPADPAALESAIIINPLYRVAVDGARTTLTLAFPNAQYEEEFGECRRYLPESVTVEAILTSPLLDIPPAVDVAELRRRRVLIEAPKRYV